MCFFRKEVTVDEYIYHSEESCTYILLYFMPDIVTTLIEQGRYSLLISRYLCVFG